MPDAGAAANPHIVTANQETLQRCGQWGYRLFVGDWGHLESKEHLDIDELLAAGRQNEIKLITSAAYFSRCHTHSLISQLLRQSSFHLTGDKLIELRPLKDSTENLDLIRHYATSIQQCRQGGYRVIVAWNDENITPEDFFALCPESIQKAAAQSDPEWEMLYNLKLWFRRMVERYRPKNGFGKKNPVPQTDYKTLDSELTHCPLKNKPALLQRVSDYTTDQQNKAGLFFYVEDPVTDKTIEYKPGKLPRWIDCSHPNNILFKKGQRLQVYTEALAAGWKHILDTSPTGTFKSHDAGIAQPKAFGVDKLWYFTSHARNVTTLTVERNYNYLEVRNSGMVWDYTPNGKPFLRWPKNEELPDTSGNCHRTPWKKSIKIGQPRVNP